MGWLICDLGGKVGMDHIEHMDGRGDMTGIGDLRGVNGVGDMGCKVVMSGKGIGAMGFIVRMGIIGGMRFSWNGGWH